MSESSALLPSSALQHSSAGRSVAVVGGGLAGLTAALELARSGLQVTVFEQASLVGGRARSREISGFCFNMGPHALYAKGAACRILAAHGVKVKGHRPPLQGGLALIGGKTDLLPIGLSSLLRARWLPWGAKFQALGLMARLSKVEASAWRGKTVEQWLQGTLSRPEARQLFVALLRLSTYSAEPEGLEAATAIRQLQLGFEGSVLYLDGGWQTLVDDLERLAEESGARWATNGRVRSVERRADGWQVVSGAGDPAIFSEVVLAVGPSQVLSLLGSELPSTLASSLQALQPIDAACLDVALRRLPDATRLFALGIDQPTYVSVHSATASLAPEGGALIHVMRYLDAAATLDRQEVERDLEGLLDLLQPGWRPLLVERQLMPRLRVCHGLHDLGVERPTEGAEELPGLFLAGDYVGDEGLLADAAVSSGQRAAQRILARRGLQQVAA